LFAGGRGGQAAIAILDASDEAVRAGAKFSDVSGLLRRIAQSSRNLLIAN